MNISLAYPSVPSFPQSSILLKRGKAGTALLQRQPWALFKLLLPSRGESPGRIYTGVKVLPDCGEQMELQAFHVVSGGLQKFYDSRLCLQGWKK